MFKLIKAALRTIARLPTEIQLLRNEVRSYHNALDGWRSDLKSRRFPVIVTARGAYLGAVCADPDPGCMGGTVWLAPGEKRIVYLQPQRPFGQLVIEAKGGVIQDVMIGNASQLVGYHEESALTHVKCSTVCQVGSRIRVDVWLPDRDTAGIG